MTDLPENRRRDEALRRYMLAADTLAALAEMLVEREGPESPVVRAVRSTIVALDLGKIGVRALGADAYEPPIRMDDSDIVIGANTVAPDANALAGRSTMSGEPDRMTHKTCDGPWCRVPRLMEET